MSAVAACTLGLRSASLLFLRNAAASSKIASSKVKVKVKVKVGSTLPPLRLRRRRSGNGVEKTSFCAESFLIPMMRQSTSSSSSTLAISVLSPESLAWFAWFLDDS